MEHTNDNLDEWCRELKASLAYLGKSEFNEMIAANLVEIIHALNNGYGLQQTARRIVVQP